MFKLIQRPIHRLRARQRKQYLRHLLRLDSRDRYLRFGYYATDGQIEEYVAGLNFETDTVLGIYDAFARLIAAAHLSVSAPAQDNSDTQCRVAEFGVSVLPRARQCGYGQRLFERACLVAQNLNIQYMWIHALRENTAMMKIAYRAGAHIEHWQDESEARVRLGGRRPDTVVKEMLGHRIAAIDYRLKWLYRRLWREIYKLR